MIFGRTAQRLSDHIDACVERTTQRLADHIEECNRLRAKLDKQLDAVAGKLDQLLAEKNERVGAAGQERRAQLGRGAKVSIAAALLSGVGPLLVKLGEFVAGHWRP